MAKNIRHCPRCKSYVKDNQFCTVCDYQFDGKGKAYHNNHLREIKYAEFLKGKENVNQNKKETV